MTCLLTTNCFKFGTCEHEQTWVTVMHQTYIRYLDLVRTFLERVEVSGETG
uniref:Uncharacterized protein n=1 Tax=Setaria italica TaxID=4555 RepID=K3YNX4_SETIT